LKKLNSINSIAIVIGLLSIFFGAYNFALGGEWEDLYFSLFVGASLAGTGYINQKELKKKSKKRKF